MKKEFYYPSADGATQIHAVEWIPEGEVRAILQISHGMVEYIDRYDEFASWLTEKGWYVTGNDHLGHGKSVSSEEKYGFFHETDGNRCVIADIHRLRERTEQTYPGVPYFMMGHSMGSFLVRQYLFTYGNGLAGAIIMGTGHKSAAVLNLGQMLCRIIAGVKGWNFRSNLINALGIGSYNKKFEPCESKKEWVTSDPEIRGRYEADPLCGFVFTVNGYHQMFEGMKELTKRSNMKKMPKNLPLLFVSGEKDPVGGFGKDVKKVYESYLKAGMKNAEIRLYENDRHEILNEQDRRVVYEELYQWMERNLSG